MNEVLGHSGWGAQLGGCELHSCHCCVDSEITKTTGQGVVFDGERECVGKGHSGVIEDLV